MSNTEKTFIPAPNRELGPPPDGPLELGTILCHPKKPKRSLNPETRLEPTTKVFPHQQRGVKVTNVEIRNRSAGIFSTFLAGILGIGVDVGGQFASQAAWAVKCASIDTTWFQPSRAFIFDSLQDEEVQAWGNELLWRRPVYMITGLKVARGVSMESLDASAWNVAAQLKLDGTGQGVPVSTAPGGSLGSASGSGVTWKSSDDFVFAYTLIKIKRKRNEQFTEKDWTKGALFDRDDAPVKKETVEDLDESWDFEEMMDFEDGDSDSDDEE